MKNKLLLCASLIALSAAILTGCQKKEDLFAIESQIAQNTMKGIYTYLVSDSVQMRTTLYEWQLNEENGEKKGFYRVRKSGNGAVEQTEEALKWESVMSEDHLKMNLKITLAGGTVKEAVWADGVLYIDDYTTGKVANSVVAFSERITESFANLVYEFADTSYYTAPDSIPYLAWKSDVAFYDPADTATAKQQYLDDLAAYTDTIKWFVKKFGPFAHVSIDSITGELTPLVVVDTTASKRGKNKGKHGITYIVSYADTIVEDVNVGYEKIVNTSMVFNRDNSDNNTGEYKFRSQEWSLEYYKDPTSKKATMSDSIYNLTNAQWMITDISTQRKFNVLMRGDKYVKSLKSVAGEETEHEETSTEPVCETLQLSNFNMGTGVIDCNGITYKLKTE